MVGAIRLSPHLNTPVAARCAALSALSEAPLPAGFALPGEALGVGRSAAEGVGAGPDLAPKTLYPCALWALAGAEIRVFRRSLSRYRRRFRSRLPDGTGLGLALHRQRVRPRLPFSPPVIGALIGQRMTRVSAAVLHKIGPRADSRIVSSPLFCPPLAPCCGWRQSSSTQRVYAGTFLCPPP